MIKILKKNKKIVIAVLVVLLAYYLYTEHVAKKNTDNFEDGVSEFMYFSATWCGHCNEFKPVWQQLVAHVDETPEYNNRLRLSNYDSEADEAVFSTYNVKQFPTLILKKADGSTVEYKNNRDLSSLKLFLEDNV